MKINRFHGKRILIEWKLFAKVENLIYVIRIHDDKNHCGNSSFEVCLHSENSSFNFSSVEKRTTRVEREFIPFLPSQRIWLTMLQNMLILKKINCSLIVVNKRVEIIRDKLMNRRESRETFLQSILKQLNSMIFGLFVLSNSSFIIILS